MNEIVKQKILSFTDDAIVYFIDRLKTESALGVRISLKKAGCSNWKYDLAYVTEINDSDEFIQVTPNLKIYVDKAAIPFIYGSLVDYVKTGINRKITFINPNESNSCGCGESFNV